MADQRAAPSQLACINCGYEAPAGDPWVKIVDPTLGTLTKCPECASTRVENRPAGSIG